MADQTGMQPAVPQEAPAVPVVKQVKQLLSQDKIKEKFGEVLGQKAPQFMASITNTVSGSTQLKKCPANSIIGAAFVAATYDLPIDSNLGFAAIVPYNESVWNPKKKDWEKVPKAQFQMMYKGFIQLAIRSGYYERMNYAVVYKDELESYNPITGEIKFVEDFSNCKQRDAGDEANVAGYYAWFRLKTGYSQELYMSKKAVDNHARKYSQAYRYDLNKGKKSSKWTTDFEAMALKTVIKLLLSKWGILSVDMQRAIQDDQKTYDETEMSELEAWAIVRKAIGRSNYYAEEEFEKLPEACKMAVGNPSNLREWAMMDSDQVGTVEQSHFVRNYRTAMQRIKEDRRVPEKVRIAIAEVKKQQMQIEDRREKPKLPAKEEKEEEIQGEMSEETRRKLDELRGKIGSSRR